MQTASNQATDQRSGDGDGGAGGGDAGGSGAGARLRRRGEPDAAGLFAGDAVRPAQDDQNERKAAEREEEEVQQKAAAGAHIVYKAISKVADEELSRPTIALAWSGLAAGLSMGFSLVTEGLLRAHLPQARWTPLVSKWGYSVGFLIVVLGRQQLFTENTLTPVLPLLRERNWQTLRNVLRLWVTVLITNILGAAAFAYTIERSGAFTEPVKQAFLQIGMESMDHPFFCLVIKGIFAGWLIALMVWQLPVAETGRIHVIIIITYIVGLGELSHIIAGSVDTIYTIAAGKYSWWDYFAHWAAPTLIGNVFGGVALVAVVNYAQVEAGSEG